MTLDRGTWLQNMGAHHAEGRHLPYAHLLRLNRQLRRELLERVPLYSTLIIDVGQSVAPLRTPLQLLYTAHVELRIDLAWREWWNFLRLSGDDPATTVTSFKQR